MHVRTCVGFSLISSDATINIQTDLIHHQFSMSNLKFCLLVLLVIGAFSQDEIHYSTAENVNISDYGTKPPPGASIPSQSNSQSLTRSAKPDSSSNDANAYMRSNLLGKPQWVYPKDTSGKMIMYPNGHWTYFSTFFNTDCPQKGATITIYAYPWQYSVVILNGQVVYSGWGTFTFSTINYATCGSCLQCGCNTLSVYVWVPCWCYVGIGISVRQDTRGCYDCDRETLAFYNRKTCQCECVSQCRTCNNYMQQWYDYPTCACICGKSYKCNQRQWFNKQTCQCECNRTCCPKGMVQSNKTCLCEYSNGGCKPPYPYCSGGYFNPNTCQCEYYATERTEVKQVNTGPINSAPSPTPSPPSPSTPPTPTFPRLPPGPTPLSPSPTSTQPLFLCPSGTVYDPLTNTCK